MSDIGYTLELKNQVNIRGSYLTTEPRRANQVTRGERAEINLHFPTDDLVVSGSYTVSAGDVEQYDEIVVESGATLTIEGELYGNTLDNDGTVTNNGTLTVYGSVISRVQDLADYAGSYAEQTTLNGTVKFRNQIPSNADVNSLVVGVEPSANIQDNDVDGFWGIVDRGSDTRNTALSDGQYQLQLTVLAELAEYNDHTAIENDLQL